MPEEEGGGGNEASSGILGSKKASLWDLSTAEQHEWANRSTFHVSYCETIKFGARSHDMELEARDQHVQYGFNALSIQAAKAFLAFLCE